ncbi:MAG: hypothetical protein RLZZ385_1880, partial [Pseudomonadota bacterium]
MKVKSLIVLSLLCGATYSGLLTAQTGGDYSAPRTEWGHPDLQGVWNFSSTVPMNRPRQFGDR